MLFFNRINAVACFGFGGFDVEPVLLGGGGEESAHAVRLPRGRFHDLRQGRPLGPSDQFQDFRALALGARRADLFCRGGLGRLLTGLGVLLRRGSIGLAALGGFLALGRTLLLDGTLLIVNLGQNYSLRKKEVLKTTERRCTLVGLFTAQDI